VDARSAERSTYIRKSEALPRMGRERAYRGERRTWGNSSDALGDGDASSTFFIVLPKGPVLAKTAGYSRLYTTTTLQIISQSTLNLFDDYYIKHRQSEFYSPRQK
jgi:hypothetical protein